MIKINTTGFIGFCLLFSAQVSAQEAASAPTDVSDQCVVSIRNVYRFYYHQVHPNPDPACHNNKRMANGTEQEMQGVIAELKTNCPASVIAQVNQSLQSDTQVG